MLFWSAVLTASSYNLEWSLFDVVHHCSVLTESTFDKLSCHILVGTLDYQGPGFAVVPHNQGMVDEAYQTPIVY